MRSRAGMEIIPVARLDDVISRALGAAAGADCLGRGHQVPVKPDTGDEAAGGLNRALNVPTVK